MDNLSFGTYARIVRKSMKGTKTQKDVAELLLGLITENTDINNQDGEPYYVTDKIASRLFNCKINVNKKIKEASNLSMIREAATDYFEDIVMPEFMSEMISDMIFEFSDLLSNDDSISLKKKEDLLKLAKLDSVHIFLSKLFLYVVNKNNIFLNEPPVPIEIKLPTVGSDAKKLRILLENFQGSQPPRIHPPSEIESHEMVYVRELLAAYADAEGLDELPKESLEAFPKHEKDFQRKRKDYYAAESLRRGSRDVFGEMASEHFDILKEETYDGIIDIYESEFPDGLARLRGVMNQASQIQVDKCVYSQIQHWIGNSEKKGVCHMLVNDGKLSGWVERNE
jgi:hypothetical protein